MKSEAELSSMNEAELQAQFKSVLDRVLPLLSGKIKLERYIHLRLGHSVVELDGTSKALQSIRGRYDLVVFVDEVPLILAELKAPDASLVDDDVAQALSYARLHIPMVPLVLVTDGENTQLIRTYDAAPLEVSDIETRRLKEVIQAASMIASSDRQDAIQALLGSSAAVWGQIFSEWTLETIGSLVGPISDFSYPISEELNIPREVSSVISRRICSGTSSLILHGPPMSGITNVLVQVCSNLTDRPILFLDSIAIPDVLQHIANRLARVLNVPVSKDDLRGWLNTRIGLVGLVIAVDGIPKTGFDELVEFANAGSMQLVLGLGTDAYERAMNAAGRVKRPTLGLTADVLELQPMEDSEFQESLRIIDEGFGARFFAGVHHVLELRWPRTLRVAVAGLPSDCKSESRGDHVSIMMIAPIIGPNFLASCTRAMGMTAEIQFDLSKLAMVFLMEVEESSGKTDWLLATWGRPSLCPERATRHLSEKRLARLLQYGLVSWFETKDLGPRLLIRLEELLLNAVKSIWANRLKAIDVNDEDFGSEFVSILTTSESIPLGEVALAGAIVQAADGNPDLVLTCLQELGVREPTTSILGEGTSVELLSTDRRIRLRFGQGMEEEVIGNLQPWLVLSHLASYPMAFEGETQTINAEIFSKIGNTRHLMFMPRPSDLERFPKIHLHEIEGVGPMLCMSTGIIEPLTQSMLTWTHEFPADFVKLARHALELEKWHLAWRMLLVAREAQTSTNEEVSSAAETVMALLDHWWRKALETENHVDE